MPRTSTSRSSSPPKSAFRKVTPVGGLTQRTPVASPPSVPSKPVGSPQTVVVEQQSSVWQSMKQGFGWGIGTSIARNMFGGGPTVSPIVPPSASSVVSVPTNTTQELVSQPAYNQCRKEGGNHESCKQYLS
jgi:hypothetical protein